MFHALKVELLKLKGSKIFWFTLLISFIFGPINYLRQVINNQTGTTTWKSFLTSNQEFMVFGMLIFFVLITCFIFGMEHQFNTISYIFTTPITKYKILITKLLTLLLIICTSFLISFVSNILFGYLAVHEMITADLALSYFKAMFVSSLIYFALTPFMAMVSIILKKYIFSSTLIIGYFILVFPFHLKGNAYICPLMLPTLVSSKILNSTDFIFHSYFLDIDLNYFAIGGLLAALIIIPLVISAIFYKKVDTI